MRQILLEKDPHCPLENINKFCKMVSDLSKFLGVKEEDQSLVDTLMKVELKLNHLIEARNFLNDNDKREAKGGAFFNQKKTVEQYEREIQKERMDKIVKEKQNEQAAQKSLVEKMEKKKARMANLKDFRG